MLGVPDVAEVRDWCGVTTSTITDEDLSKIREAELAVQSRLLDIPDDPDPATGAEATYPAPLVTALLRRCQRAVAAKQVPLGMVGDSAGEYGATYLRSWDPEIERLENPYRLPVIA